MRGEPFSEVPEELEGSLEVTVRCSPGEMEEVPACDGWSESVQLEEEPFLNESGYLELPGYGHPECGNCGNPHDFEINGKRIFWG